MVDYRKLLERRRRAHERFDQGEEPRTSRPVNHNISIKIAGNDYAVKFDRILLDVFKKAVPEHQRRWIKDRYVWLVLPEAIALAAQAFEDFTQTAITIPEISIVPPQIYEKTFLLEYLAITKLKGARKVANGWVNGDWSAEFPEDVLRQFFEGREDKQPVGVLQTLYQVLCVFESVESEAIKSAYRRLARQWHPDVCKEIEAAEMFRKINEAYQVLIDPNKRQRYDAGLYFERQGQEKGWATKITRRPRVGYQYGYRAPLRCGTVTAIGVVRLMRFVVSEITKWEDVVNNDGKVMLAQWPAGADTFQVLWV